MKRQFPKAIAAGHICLDITPVFPEGRSAKLSEILRPGKLLEMKGCDIHTGGAVANTGLAMKILGVDVSLMGKIGDDEFGRIVLDALKKYNADEGMIIAQGEQTSYSVVIAPPGVDRIFLHDPGTNNTFSADDVNISAEQSENTALFHFGYPPLMKKMYENGGAELEKLFKKVKEMNMVTSLDMAAVDPGSEAGQVDWNALLKRVLPYVDFFVPSVEELCYMLDKNRLCEWENRTEGADLTSVIEPENDVRPLAEKCLEYGAKAVLVKCGAPGMYFMSSKAGEMSDICKILNLNEEEWADIRRFKESMRVEKVVSATGAGDTSIAGFLTSLLMGMGPEKCLDAAAAAGARCVTTVDALSGLVPLKDMEELL